MCPQWKCSEVNSLPDALGHEVPDSLAALLPESLFALRVGAEGLHGDIHRQAGEALGPPQLSRSHVGAAAALQDAHSPVLGRLGQARHEGVGEPAAHAPRLCRCDLQVGGCKAGVGRQGLHFAALLLDPVVQRCREDTVCQLGLMVPLPPGPSKEHGGAVAPQVAPILTVVLCLDRSVRHLACLARVLHHSCFAVLLGRLLQKRPQFFGEQEVREMVCLHLNIIAILGGLVWQGHHTSVAAQHVDAFPILLLQLLGATPHRV
mmetsp:Transcript_38107/g.107656  ORF Transcript_38107/g.107656 Transcript_38107/m.107656 type:complete len:262 (-) Transcript_38107:375-1160(-)